MGNQSGKADGSDFAKMPIPKTMRRLVLEATNPDPKKIKINVETVDVPKPESGELLVRVVSASVNPSDYGEWLRGDKTLDKGKAIGKEGAGVVVATGGGISTVGISVGERVGFVNLQHKQGAYSEYVVVSAMMGAFPLPDDVKTEDASSFFVNPYTVVGILDTMEKEAGSPGLIHTAAASSLGKMMVKICKQRKISLINVVRRQEQADMLRKLGAKHVVITSGDKATWMKQLKDLIDKLKITAAFDCVSGSMPGDLISLLPRGGTCYVYGTLSRQPVGNIPTTDLIYAKKKVKGWLLTYWIKQGGLVQMLLRIRNASATVNPGLKRDGWCSTKFVDCQMDTMYDRFVDMFTKSGFTDRKLRIRFDLKNTAENAAEDNASTPESKEG